MSCDRTASGLRHNRMETPTTDKVPVILDTDIGDDIDDTWALAMLLQSPELDLDLVVADTGDST
mgnify:CR=1 FL=1